MFFISVFLFGSSCSNFSTNESDNSDNEILPDSTNEEKFQSLNTPQDTLLKYWLAEELIDTFYLEQTQSGTPILTWKHLSHVKFNEVYTEEVEAYVPYPIFHPSIQKLQGQKVAIKGYIIPIEETGDETLIVLSARSLW